MSLAQSFHVLSGLRLSLRIELLEAIPAVGPLAQARTPSAFLSHMSGISELQGQQIQELGDDAFSDNSI